MEKGVEKVETREGRQKRTADILGLTADWGWKEYKQQGAYLYSAWALRTATLEQQDKA